MKIFAFYIDSQVENFEDVCYIDSAEKQLSQTSDDVKLFACAVESLGSFSKSNRL